MKQIDITPRAHEDLADLKAYLQIEFGATCAQKLRVLFGILTTSEESGNYDG